VLLLVANVATTLSSQAEVAPGASTVQNLPYRDAHRRMTSAAIGPCACSIGKGTKVWPAVLARPS